MIRIPARSVAAALLPLALAASPAPAQAPVTGDRAVAAFMDVCVGLAPAFADARPVMARHGLTDVADTGTVYHPSGTLSVKIQDFTRNDGTSVVRCSVVTEAPDFTGIAAMLTEELAARTGLVLEGPGEMGGRPAWFARGELGGSPVDVAYVGGTATEQLSLLVVEVLP